MPVSERWGLELELLLPRGARRADFAGALASAFGGSARHTFKHLEWPCHVASTACTVLDGDGRWLLSLVDDLSIEDDLDAASDAGFRVVMEDARLADAFERVTAASEGALLAQVGAQLGADIAAPGARGCAPRHRLVHRGDERLAVIVPETSERQRVAEVVSAPLTAAAIEPFLRKVYACARAFGARPARDGGMHVHVDAAPWQSTGALRALILRYSTLRDRVLPLFGPNPVSAEWRGPFSRAVQDAALKAGDAMPFAFFRRWLLELGVAKKADINLLGALRERPKQPTIEVRILPVELDLSRTLERLEAVNVLLERMQPR